MHNKLLHRIGRKNRLPPGERGVVSGKRMDTPKYQMMINLDKLKDIALKGVRRSAVFMGLGINASGDSRLDRYQLAHLTGFELVPETASQESVIHFKEEFSLWIVECGLRELIERFALFLDAVHHACVILAVNRGKMAPEQGEMHQRSFTRKGLEDKLKKLKDRSGCHQITLSTLPQSTRRATA